MSSGRIRWSLLIVAAICLVAVAGGIFLLVAGNRTGQIYGWALIGFFGAGVVVLGRSAFTPR